MEDRYGQQLLRATGVEDSNGGASTGGVPRSRTGTGVEDRYGSPHCSVSHSTAGISEGSPQMVLNKCVSTVDGLDGVGIKPLQFIHAGPVFGPPLSLSLLLLSLLFSHIFCVSDA